MDPTAIDETAVQFGVQCGQGPYHDFARNTPLDDKLPAGSVPANSLWFTPPSGLAQNKFAVAVINSSKSGILFDHAHRFCQYTYPPQAPLVAAFGRPQSRLHYFSTWKSCCHIKAWNFSIQGTSSSRKRRKSRFFSEDGAFGGSPPQATYYMKCLKVFFQFIYHQHGCL